MIVPPEIITAWQGANPTAQLTPSIGIWRIRCYSSGSCAIGFEYFNQGSTSFDIITRKSDGRLRIAAKGNMFSREFNAVMCALQLPLTFSPTGLQTPFTFIPMDIGENSAFWLDKLLAP